MWPVHGRVHDLVWGTVRVVVAFVLLGLAWQMAQTAERGGAADLAFRRLEIHDAEGRDTGRLKVCGDRYQEPFCLRAEHVTVDDVMLKLNKKGGARYQFEFGRSGGRTLELSLDVDSEDQDVVEAASGRGEATLYWWRDSLRLLKVSAGGHERTIRAAHYPGGEFTPPAAFGAVLAGLGVAALWAGLWRIVRGGASRLSWPWQTTAPGVTFTLAGLGGALGALFATHSHSVRTMAWTAGVVGAVSAVGMARWAYRWTRRSLPEVDRMEPIVPVDERRFPGVVWGPGPWKALSIGWLRAGPQGLAAVPPGPAVGTGTFGVQPFPGPLRLIRVRTPYRDDPLRVRFNGSQRKSDGVKQGPFAVVAECEALGGPAPGARVLIGADRDDMPYVLGVLSAAASFQPDQDDQDSHDIQGSSHEGSTANH
ncbi:predicted protein [Streptomyces viridosporus ATCC 14672]|uniref:Predicted protein n=1 Tax=Streptomyces viridosporus (strain ATCC 14672 / DSM 40746 / JCM 4963 / KCTC 9882 / NRRL B-12104 / FH 1290) TaxID=566461 RepID=D5ZU42_STRV1|nr:predicted protein [Streptomyces viridosporus ATCC 14672]